MHAARSPCSTGRGWNASHANVMGSSSARRIDCCRRLRWAESGRGFAGDLDSELAAPAYAGTAGDHRAAMGLDEPTSEIEAKPHPRLDPTRMLAAREEPKDRLQLPGCDSISGIADGDEDGRTVRLRAHVDVPMRIGVFAGIGDDVLQRVRETGDVDEQVYGRRSNAHQQRVPTFARKGPRRT